MAPCSSASVYVISCYTFHAFYIRTTNISNLISSSLGCASVCLHTAMNLEGVRAGWGRAGGVLRDCESLCIHSSPCDVYITHATPRYHHHFPSLRTLQMAANLLALSRFRLSADPMMLVPSSSTFLQMSMRACVQIFPTFPARLCANTDDG